MLRHQWGSKVIELCGDLDDVAISVIYVAPRLVFESASGLGDEGVGGILGRR